MTVVGLLVLFAQAAWAGDQGDSAVLAGGGGEFYIAAMPPGWGVNGENLNPKGAVTNWVPEPQLGDDWRELISLQIFTGLADFPFNTFLEGMIERYRSVCEEVFATDIEESRRNGYAVAFRIVACTKSSRNAMGEVSLFHVVPGREALYVVQRVYRVASFTASRFPLAAEELTRCRASIEFGLACRRGDETRACPADWRSVLDALATAAPITVFPAAP